MLKSSLLEIIRTFSKQELIKFEDFVRSPYFNKKENVIKLFLATNKYAPEFSGENLEKEKVWKVIFPAVQYNYGIMKNLIFDLNKLTVKFIEMENYSKKKFDSEINILEQLFLRGLSPGFEKKSSEISNFLSNEKVSADQFYQKYVLGRIDLDYLYVNYTVRNIKKIDFDSLNRNLILNFFSNYLNLNINILLCQIHFKVNSGENFLDNILDLYLKSDFKNYYTEIFFYIFKCSLDQNNDEHYFKLKELYYENFEKLNPTDKYMVSEALILYCINKTNTGNLKFEKERLQFHKILDVHNLLVSEKTNRIEGYMFVNTNVAACSSSDFEWAEKFIEKYRSKLDPEESIKIVNLAYAHLYFKKQEYEKALTFLSRCDNAYGMDKVNIKTYEVFLYYELRYYEELKNLIDTTKHYIKNDNLISEDVRRIFRNFIDAVYKLNEYRYKLGNKVAENNMLFDIKNFVSENEMPHKSWLNNKLSELENE